jgi:hypothetical protein
MYVNPKSPIWCNSDIEEQRPFPETCSPRSQWHMRPKFRAFPGQTGSRLKVWEGQWPLPVAKSLAHKRTRIGALLYIIDVTLVTCGRNASNGECPAALCVPLPCGKELWDSIGNSSWSKLYQGHKQTARSSQLTLGTLLLVRNDGELFGTKERSPKEVKDSLSEWCRNADDFGLLLWMATSLEHHEQTLLRNVREPV